MEQQNKRASTPQCTEDLQPQQPYQPLHQLYQRDTRSLPPSPSSPATPSYPQTDDPLSISEPSLRFPRPVGSRHLANWVSTSNPDLMRLTDVTEAESLTGSTYEVISGADDSEAWSLDGNEGECISESVSSLDFRRSDDIQSLASTEQMTDDEDSQTPLEPGESRFNNTTGPPGQRIPTTSRSEDDAVESEPGDEAASGSSLEYTQQSLKVPSMAIPEAGSVLEIPEQKNGLPRIVEELILKLAHVRGWLKEESHHLQGVYPRALYWGHLAVSAVLFSVLYALLYRCISLLDGYNDPSIPAVTTNAATTPLLLTHTKATSSSRPLATAFSSTELTLRDDSGSHDWFFGLGKRDVALIPQSPSKILVRISDDAKKAWELDDCVTFTATRGERNVEMTTSWVNEGILVKFPWRETRGVVDLMLESTCRPSFHRVVKVRFSDSILVELAGKGLANLRSALNCEELSSSINVAKAHAAALAHDAQTALQLGLLNARISARLSWLSLVGKTKERDQYKLKGAAFLAQKETEVKAGRSSSYEAVVEAWRAWYNSVFGDDNQCHGRLCRCWPNAGKVFSC